jgi:hypothetical protein
LPDVTRPLTPSRGDANPSVGVELLNRWTATHLIANGRPTGVTVENPHHERRDLRGRLVRRGRRARLAHGAPGAIAGDAVRAAVAREPGARGRRGPRRQPERRADSMRL